MTLNNNILWKIMCRLKHKNIKHAPVLIIYYNFTIRSVTRQLLVLNYFVHQEYFNNSEVLAGLEKHPLLLGTCPILTWSLPSRSCSSAPTTTSSSHRCGSITHPGHPQNQQNQQSQGCIFFISPPGWGEEKYEFLVGWEKNMTIY